MSEVKNKIILITGAASGIGRLMALDLARRGAVLVLWDIHSENLDKVKSEIESFGGQASSHICNIADREMVNEIAARVRMEPGPVDILINNAGVVTGKFFSDYSEQEIQHTMDVNIMSHFWTVRAFLPDMIARNNGHIVSVASAAGIVGVSKLSVYCAAKFADFGFDEALRMEFRQKKLNIRTSVICPYFINTGMFAGVRTRFPILLPILKPENVARKAVSAILKNKHRVLIPPMVYTVPLLRFFPTRVFDWIADIFGINSAMNDFTGRR